MSNTNGIIYKLDIEKAHNHVKQSISLAHFSILDS